MVSQVPVKYSVSQGTLSLNLVGLQNKQYQVNTILQKVFPGSTVNAPALKEISPHFMQQVNNVQSYLNSAYRDCKSNDLISVIKTAVMAASIAGLIIGASSASLPLIIVSLAVLLTAGTILNREAYPNPTDGLLQHTSFKEVLLNHVLALEGSARIWKGTEAMRRLDQDLRKGMEQCQENAGHMQAIHDFYQERLPGAIAKLQKNIVQLETMEDAKTLSPKVLEELQQEWNRMLDTLKTFQAALTPSAAT